MQKISSLMRPTVAFSFLMFFMVQAITASTESTGAADDLDKVNLPAGFRIAVFAEVPDARSMTIDHATGTIFVGTRIAGKVYAVVDKDHDHKADRVVAILSGLKLPNGVAMHRDFLYVAETHRITRYSIAGLSLDTTFNKTADVIFTALTDNSHHGWRYIDFGPDNKLYVAAGTPCNICLPQGNEGSILRMDADGSNTEIFAGGIRNSVGFDFHPVTHVLYFTDNNTDMMGDDIPPGELNAAPAAGLHFGFPYFAGGKIRHKDWADMQPPREVTFPVIEFGAHAAALGTLFYTGEMFPAEYKNDAFVAQHGSWNRSIPFGYRIMRIKFDRDGNPVGKEVFADGWLTGAEAWGRPVDFLQLPDGSLLVSDDHLGVIYRISYEK